MKPAVVILASRTGQVSAETLESIRAFGLPVFVADHTLDYASAVRDGFGRAIAAGCSHAITIDIDMQHDPADISAFRDAIEQHPDAIIHGVRHFQPGPLAWGIQLAAFFCDVWIWLAVGRWTRDCAHAYRAYPLAAVSEISCSAAGQEFEIEILANAIWGDIKTFSQRVNVPAKFRVAVMSPLAFARYGILICRLLLKRLVLPTPVLGTLCRGEFGRLPRSTRIIRIAKQTVLHHCNPPGRFAAGVGLGVFFGVSPFWGFQMLLAAATAHLLRLSKAVMVASSNISFPLTIPFFIYLSLMIGHFLHRGEFGGMPSLDELSRPVVLRFLGEYVAGSLVLGAVLGTIFATLAYALAHHLSRSSAPPTEALLARICRQYASAAIPDRQYVKWKLKIDPIFRRIYDAVPAKASILDAGCGCGLMSIGLALASDERRITGVDLDERKLKVARQAAESLSNVKLVTADLLGWEFPPVDCVLMIDILHYWEPAKQLQLLAKAAACLTPGGLLIFREGLRRNTVGHRIVKWSERWAVFRRLNPAGDGLHFQSLKFYLDAFVLNGLVLHEQADDWGLGSNTVILLHKRKSEAVESQREISKAAVNAST